MPTSKPKPKPKPAYVCAFVYIYVRAYLLGIKKNGLFRNLAKPVCNNSGKDTVLVDKQTIYL